MRRISVLCMTLLLACSGGGEPSEPDADNGDITTDAGNKPETRLDAGDSPDAADSPDAGIPPTGTVVGAAGGTVAFGDTVVLKIPPGALAKDVEISISVGSATSVPADVTALTDVFQFEPAGTTFAVPVTVAFAVATAGNINIYWTKAGSSTEFEALDAAPFGVTGVAAQVTHFSLGFVGMPGGTTPDGCSPQEELGKPFLVDSTPVRSVVNMFGWDLDHGAGGQLYLRGVNGGAHEMLVAADGQRFEPLAMTPQTAKGQQVVDGAHDWIYEAVTNGNDVLIHRRRAAGCFEDVGTIPDAAGVDFYDVDAAGDVFGFVILRNQPEHALFGAAGTTWTLKGETPNFDAQSAAIAPSDPQRIYYATDGSHAQVRYSTDGGETFQTSATTIDALGDVAVDPTNPDVVYVTGYGRLWVSTDGGAHFDQDASQPPGNVHTLRITSDQRVWAMTSDNAVSKNVAGLYVRSDGSTTWTEVLGDLPADERGGFGLAIEETTPFHLWRTGVSGIVWQSLDAGATWTSDVSGLPGLSGHPLATDPTDENVFYLWSERGSPASWYRTTDGGHTLTRLSLGDSGVSSMLMVLADGTLLAFSQIFVGDAPHLGQRSTDRGATFTPMTGLPFDTDFGIGIGIIGAGAGQREQYVWPDVDPHVAYYLHGSGDFYRTVDAGVTWATVFNTKGTDGNGNAYTDRVLVDPTVSMRLYAWRRHGGQSADEFLVSTDGGETWAPLAIPDLRNGGCAIDSAGRVWASAVDATTAEQALWTLQPGATAFTPVTTLDSFSGGLPRFFGDAAVVGKQRSTDGGATWTQDNAYLHPTVDLFDQTAFTHRANPKRAFFHRPALRTLLLP